MTKEKPKNKILRWLIIMLWDIIGISIFGYFIFIDSTYFTVMIYDLIALSIIYIIVMDFIKVYVVKENNKYRLKNIETHC